MQFGGLVRRPLLQQLVMRYVRRCGGGGGGGARNMGERQSLSVERRWRLRRLEEWLMLRHLLRLCLIHDGSDLGINNVAEDAVRREVRLAPRVARYFTTLRFHVRLPLGQDCLQVAQVHLVKVPGAGRR